MAVRTIESVDQFEAIKREEKRLVVIDAFADWCGPCKAIAPTIAQWSISEMLKDRVVFAKFDVDKLPDLAQILGVRAMPTFILFKNGEKVHEFVGANPRALLDLINKFAGADETEAADADEAKPAEAAGSE